MTAISIPTPNTGTRLRHNVGFWAIAFAFLTVLAYNAVPAPLRPIIPAAAPAVAET